MPYQTVPSPTPYDVPFSHNTFSYRRQTDRRRPHYTISATVKKLANKTKAALFISQSIVLARAQKHRETKVRYTMDTRSSSPQIRISTCLPYQLAKPLRILTTTMTKRKTSNLFKVAKLLIHGSQLTLQRKQAHVLLYT